MRKVIGEFTKGIFRENPVVVMALGLCPALAVSTSLTNGLGMGLAATFVLLGSNIIISTIRRLIPAKIRLPCFIVVIASFVTIVELFMAAYLPALAKALGIYVPLIVVNCIILGRAEAFASKHSLSRSILDALGMGFGFTLALALIASIREILGSGKILGLTVTEGFQPAIFFILAPGAFLVIGFLMAAYNVLTKKK